MSAQLVAEHMAYAAKNIAATLAKLAKNDAVLREALHTVKLGPNTVRIGGYDIIRRNSDNGPAFDISSAKNGKILVSGMMFYETCHMIIKNLNNNQNISAIENVTLIRNNGRYIRVMADINDYISRMEYYENRGQYDKAFVIEDRLQQAQLHAELLRKSLNK